MHKPEFLIVPMALIEDTNLSPSDRLVYSVIYWFERLRDGTCKASNQTIADILGMSSGGVSNSISTLKKNGYIEIDYADEYKSVRKNIRCSVTFKVGMSGNVKVPSSDYKVPSTDEQNKNISNINNKGSFKTKYYSLDVCSRGVKYAVEKLKLRPTESLVTLIDEEFREYAIAPSVNTMLAWCETKSAKPSVVTLSKWLKRDLDSGTLKQKRRS